ncbi:ClpXP protease specificity-enhancing factor [Reinekea marina]|uniref:ClpXP protease specificity-enhancing factor n=1 Tax=Reinekea marina TaxID=1310421 RepID=A0ABV7WWW6_9GAMM|nr:ClpXP protease specificity-enhancing factor [Reinekea marina]MBU2862507.1 ClpXP protease specificity-enhancing factor [Reinekea forsetii]MDN3647993.1 ClpXP protease specificity-enhancing factor [Reinekea marina]
MSDMTSNKPYMIRAIHEWILDNECTPYLVLLADFPGVEVPQDFVRDGQITLNISPTAVKELDLGDSAISFTARFGGVPTEISGPVDAVVAVFAKENGQGMGFEVELPPEPETPEPSPDQSSKRPALKVVK